MDSAEVHFCDCGAQIPDDVSFCNKCEENLERVIQQRTTKGFLMEIKLHGGPADGMKVQTSEDEQGKVDEITIPFFQTVDCPKRRLVYKKGEDSVFHFDKMLQDAA